MREIVFFSMINGVADAFPIDHAKNFKFNWAESARKDYKEKIEIDPGIRFNHLYRCPGIFDLLNNGFIMPLPWDVTIETNGDGEHFAWSFPSNDLQSLFQPPLLTGHFADKTAKYLPHKPGTLKTIIKLNTPWHVIVPEDVKFMMIPIPYPDNYDFENVPGILDPSLSSEINFQLRWNVLDGIRTIRAGTPMAQIVPMTNEKFKLTVRNGTAKDLEWVEKRKYLNNCTMAIKRPMVQNLYKKYFNKETILSKISRYLQR